MDYGGIIEGGLYPLQNPNFAKMLPDHEIMYMFKFMDNFKDFSHRWPPIK
jgi:hypothetical protein